MTTTETVHTSTVDGTTVTCTDSGGSGAPLLLVHAGLFADWFVPLAREPELSHHRVLRMVRAGYVPGRAPAGPLSVADHAAHCATLLEEVGAGAAHVVGHSSGSAVALQLAHDRPDLVRSLTLSEPPLIDSLVASEDLESVRSAVGPVVGAAMAAAAAGDLDGAYDAFMDAVCGPGHRAVLDDVLGPGAARRAVRESAFFFADEAGAVAGWTPPGPGAGLDLPVVLVRGADSPPPTHHLVDRLAASFPEARVVTVDDANHLLPLTASGALARAVESAAARAGTAPTHAR